MTDKEAPGFRHSQNIIDGEEEIIVDLKHLRDITDSNKEVEEELFELFVSNSEECVAVLESNWTDGDNMKWRGAAHEFKGSAASLGAFSLSKRCAEAQEGYTKSSVDKRKMLDNIKLELDKVKEFLHKLHA